MQPEAATLAPFQKRRMPSSCMRIWAVRIEVILVEPIAYKCVLRVSTGYNAKCSTIPAMEPQTQCLNKLILVVSLSSQSIKSSDIFDGSDGYFIVDI